MSVCPAPRRRQRALSALSLLLLCLLAAGCAARGRSAAVPTATFTATPAPVRFLAVPTFTPTVTPVPPPTATPTVTPTATVTLVPPPTATLTPTLAPTLTPSAQAAGVYANLEVHPGGSYRLQRRGDMVEADLVSTSSAVQHAARQPPQVLFTLPPAFRPPFPVWRRVVGQPVRADGSPDPASPDPRPFRLQLEPDGRVHYLDPLAGADLDYLAYSLHLTWGITPAANDQAVLQLLAEVGKSDIQPRVKFADGRLTSLNLDANQLTTLPPEIGQLQNLERLDLGRNQLTALPPAVGSTCTNLRRLHLYDNQLTALPPAARPTCQPADGCIFTITS